MRLFIIATYAALLLIISPPSLSAYTTMTLEGVKQANGVWTAAGVVDNMGFVRTTGSLTVAGSVASTAVALPVDRVAASAILKNTVRTLGPVAMAGLAAYDVYDWFTSEGIKSDGQQWVTSPFGGTRLCGVRPHSYAPVGCYMYANTQTAAGCSVDFGLGSYKGTIGSLSGYWCLDDKLQWGDRPATQADLDKLALASLGVLAQGFNILPSGQGMPIPISGLQFKPFSVWSSDPYFKNGNWYRDRTDVSPAPTPSQPTRVKVDIGPVKIEGATNPDAVPDTGPAGGGSSPQPEKEKPSFCEANPQSIACAEMGSLEQEPFDPVEKPFQITPQNPWGSGDAQCPAPKVMQLTTGSTVTLSYQPACDFFRGVRPAVLALALLAALYIALGIPVGKGD